MTVALVFLWINKKFCEEITAYFLLIRYGLHRKKKNSNNSSLRGNVFTVPLLSMDGGIHRERESYRLPFDKIWTTYKMTHPIIFLLSMYSLPREPLPSTEKMDALHRAVAL
jgi:hypothetical protein